MLNTRFNNCAQVIAKDGMYAGFAGAKTGHCRMALGRALVLFIVYCFGLFTLTPFGRCHPCPVVAIGLEYHMGGTVGMPWYRLVLPVCLS